MDLHPLLCQLLDAPTLTDSSTPIDSSTPVFHSSALPSAVVRPTSKPTLLDRTRKYLPPPGQFLATKRIKHSNDFYYKTLSQYNELFKQHESSLDSLLLLTSFQKFSVDVSSPNTTLNRNPFAYKHFLPKFVPFLYKITSPSVAISETNLTDNCDNKNFMFDHDSMCDDEDTDCTFDDSKPPYY